MTSPVRALHRSTQPIFSLPSELPSHLWKLPLAASILAILEMNLGIKSNPALADSLHLVNRSPNPPLEQKGNPFNITALPSLDKLHSIQQAVKARRRLENEEIRFIPIPSESSRENPTEAAASVDEAQPDRVTPQASSTSLEVYPVAFQELSPIETDSPYSTADLNVEADQRDSLLPTEGAIGQESLISQAPEESSVIERFSPLEGGSDVSGGSSSEEVLGSPSIRFQGSYLLQGDDSSARARLTGYSPLTPSLLVGATLDLTGGDAFSDSRTDGINLNELYATLAPSEVPNLRFVVGLMDLTSYFDRNSFAKDATTHFFHPVFQTNPALSAAGLGSRPGALVNWSITDHLDLKAATFSSSRNLDELNLDAVAAELGLRFGTAIVRGTYVSARDVGNADGFREIFQFNRGHNTFGLRSDDREEGYGLNGEVFIPTLNLGLFARYGWYENRELETGGTTVSLGLNLLDLFQAGDRLGLAYGRQLSNDSLRRNRDDAIPDVVELFYDIRLSRHLRAALMLQGHNQFSETIAGFRIRTEFDSRDIFRRTP